MKLIIGGYEVEIKARSTWRSKIATKRDTMSFLNAMCIFCSEASKYYETEGYEALSNGAYNWSHEIFTYLKDNGAYDNQ